jgi:hypothetical protein
MADEDLNPTTTAGYKVGEKKTLEELAKLDEQDGIALLTTRISSQMERISRRCCSQRLFYSYLQHQTAQILERLLFWLWPLK